MTDEPTAEETGLRELLADAIRAAACPWNDDCPLSEAECSEQRIQPAAWEHGVLSEVYGRPEWFADAVTHVLHTRTEAHRLTLSEALGLGTGAPWDAIHERAKELSAGLSGPERKMLAYALDQAQEKIWSEGGFTDEDQDAITSLRRLTDDGTARPPTPCKWTQTRWPHIPHTWNPEPGMDPAPCPGYPTE